MSKLSRTEKRELKKRNSLLQVKETCVNCGEHIALDQRFCSHCGGKRIYNRLTWRNLLEDFADRFLNLENSFLKTFIALWKRPEDVIGGYMNGMRKKYLPAFSYFAVAVSLSGFYTFILQGWFLDQFFSVQAGMYGAEALTAQDEASLEVTKMVTNKMLEYQSLYMFLSIPIFAIISRIVFWNYKQCNFVEHFVIYLYAYSHVSIITVILNLLTMWNNTLYMISSFLTILLLIVYITYVLKRLFKLDAARLVLKFALFLVVSFFIFLLTLIPFVAYGIAQGVKIAKGEEVVVDENSVMGAMLKPIILKEKERKEAQRRKDSIKNDSIERLKNTLEITPEMIKNRPQ